MGRVITCNCRTMHLADPAHSEHDTFSCLPLKKYNKRPQLAFILWGIIQHHIQNRSKFHIHRWTNVSTQSKLFQVKNDHFQTGCYYRQVVISFLIWNLQKLSMSKEKLRLVGSSCMTPPWKWPFYTRNAMIMWILMLIGVSETFFNFKYNVALFLKVYMLIKSLVVFFRVQLGKMWHYFYFFCDTYCP